MMRWGSGQIRSSYLGAHGPWQEITSTETTMSTRAYDTCEHLAMYPVLSKNDGKGHAMSFIHHEGCSCERKGENKLANLTL